MPLLATNSLQRVGTNSPQWEKTTGFVFQLVKLTITIYIPEVNHDFMHIAHDRRSHFLADGFRNRGKIRQSVHVGHSWADLVLVADAKEAQESLSVGTNEADRHERIGKRDDRDRNGKVCRDGAA